MVLFWIKGVLFTWQIWGLLFPPNYDRTNDLSFSNEKSVSWNILEESVAYQYIKWPATPFQQWVELANIQVFGVEEKKIRLDT